MKRLYSFSFFALFVANLCTVASFSAFFLFPRYITLLGGSKLDIGILMGAFAFASACCRPWVATMVDGFGRKRSFIVGAAILTFIPLLHMPLKGDIHSLYGLLLFLRIIHGIGLATCFTAIFTFIADLLPVNRLSEGIGIFGISGLTGLAMGPALAEVMLESFGYNVYFFNSSILAGLGLLLTLHIGDPWQRHKNSPISFWRLLRHKRQLLILGLAFTFGVSQGAISNFVTPLADSRHIPWIGGFYVYYTLAAILVRLIGGRLTDKLGERRILPAAYLLCGAGLAALTLAQSNIVLGVCGFVAGLGHGLLFPALNALTVRHRPQAIRGRLTGIFTGGIDLGLSCGSVVLGQIAQLSNLNYLFIWAALITWLGLGLLPLVPHKNASSY